MKTARFGRSEICLSSICNIVWFINNKNMYNLLDSYYVPGTVLSAWQTYYFNPNSKYHGYLDQSKLLRKLYPKETF